MHSILCSIMIAVFPESTSLPITLKSLLTSSVCSPVVGSSSMYRDCPCSPLESSLAIFSLCASPPDRDVATCPSFKYPSPTSLRTAIFFVRDGMKSKKTYASSNVISSTSWMFLPRSVTSRTLVLKRLPPQQAQLMCTSGGRKYISSFSTPSPLHASHLPPETLKEKLPAVRPAATALLIEA